MALQIFNLEWVPYNTQIDVPEIEAGKTKNIFDMQDGTYAMRHNWVLTAYDNPEFTWISVDKWIASAYSTATLFKRLEAEGIKTTHKGIINANTTREMALDMLPFEIIWRRYNVPKNSWQKRNPGIYDIWARYNDIIYEACLKWSIITDSGEIVHDPFLVLDENFQPQLDSNWLPRLTHSKTGEELTYSTVLHPNKKQDMSLEAVRNAISLFTERSSEIYNTIQKVQEITFNTYSEIGRLNADWKIELWLNFKKELILWDVIDLDSLRNMSLQEVEIEGAIYEYEKDLLGSSLKDIIWMTPNIITKIIKSDHSGKQHYRDQVDKMKNNLLDDKRKAFNNQAAQRTTDQIYIPVARALSDRFWKEVWFILSN